MKQKNEVKSVQYTRDTDAEKSEYTTPSSKKIRMADSNEFQGNWVGAREKKCCLARDGSKMTQ